MATIFKDEDFYVEVKITDTKILKVNLKDELGINTRNLHSEVLTQAGKYAWWAVAEELAQHKLLLAEGEMESVKQSLIQEYGSDDYLGDRRLKQAVVGYVRVHKQYSFLQSVREAFEHRRDTLMLLMGGQSHKSVLDTYNSKVSNYLGALSA